MRVQGRGVGVSLANILLLMAHRIILIYESVHRLHGPKRISDGAMHRCMDQKEFPTGPRTAAWTKKNFRRGRAPLHGPKRISGGATHLLHGPKRISDGAAQQLHGPKRISDGAMHRLHGPKKTVKGEKVKR